MRRDRATRIGLEMFVAERVFEDCVERIALLNRRFQRALLIGCPDRSWIDALSRLTDAVEVRDPGPLLAARGDGSVILEDEWEPPAGAYDLVLAIGTLDTVNELPLALRLIRHATRPDGLFIGALAGGETLPRLRAAMRAADALSGTASPHVHPRIEPSALAPLLEDAGFIKPVVDVDRVQVAYRSLEQLVRDLRAMAATNLLSARSKPLTRSERDAASRAFATGRDRERTLETFEIVHFAAWTAAQG